MKTVLIYDTRPREYKGKLLHLSPSNSVLDRDDLSRSFLNISASNIKKGSKQSILLLGTRMNKTLKDDSTHEQSMFGKKKGTIRKYTNLYCFIIRCVLFFALHLFRSLNESQIKLVWITYDHQSIFVHQPLTIKTIVGFCVASIQSSFLPHN